MLVKSALEESGCCFQLENYYMTDVTYVQFILRFYIGRFSMSDCYYTDCKIDFHLLR